MLLRSVILENFRAYRERTKIEIEPDLTAFIGRNDVGKSTIFDALAIFFDNPLVKIDQTDASVGSDSQTVTIACEFDVPDDPVILDSTEETTLQSEQLLNQDGRLTIVKRYDTSKKTIKPSVFILAKHPKFDGSPLISLTQQRLRAAIKANIELIEQRLGRRPSLQTNAEMRRALREAGLVEMPEGEIEVPIDDKSEIRWERLRSYLPLYALFRADRPSTDEDAEVQDPLKFAIQQILQDPSNQNLMEKLKESVRTSGTQVAQRTLEKLEEINPDLARKLRVDFRAEPRWDSLFKLTVKGDDDIPLNKRGSGVRRLMILSFFRAEAERRRAEENKQNCIYAIEEPETSQHPNVQKLLIEALRDLADMENNQVLITTHVPGLAASLSPHAIRYIRRGENDHPEILDARQYPAILSTVAQELGVSPNPLLRAIVLVEGKTDIMAFQNIFQAFKRSNPKECTPDELGVRFIYLAGKDNLRDFVDLGYARQIGLPILSILDGDAADTSVEGEAVYLKRRSIENYIPTRKLHEWLMKRDVPEEELARVVIEPDTDVPKMVQEVLRRGGRSKIKRDMAEEIWPTVEWDDFEASAKQELKDLIERMIGLVRS